ncbi:glucokinase [Burkholderiaceae bacterium UC74_6]
MSGAYPWLVADIGGTNARFGWVSAPGSNVEHVRVLPVDQHKDPASAARAYLQELQNLLPGAPAPRSGAFAVATAIAGDQIELTNAHWSFSRAATQADLGLDLLLMLNDFEALALSLPRLQAAQLRAWPAAQAQAGKGPTLAVIGPGTGLGVGGVTRTGGTHGIWLALPGEGGHATLAAGDDFEAALLAHVRGSFEHVSAERLLSGIGMPVLHGAVAAVLGSAQVPVLSTEQIVAQGLSGQDPVCERTLDAFCALLGSFAGNVALTLGARGGVYIGGGIVPRLGERFFASAFRERFEAKGRFRSYLEAIPTPLITDTLAALAGAALAIEQAQA